ncbi:hypothetical protein AAW14_11080 [Streptomyces hygroscopicus]|nr:hypothetical protein [Streptomyces hygroscopicus]
MLLVIPGGAGHPMALDRMTAHLADRFTGVTYAPLGLAHGRLGLPVGEQHVEGTAALKSVSARLTLAVGTGSRGHLLHRTASSAAQLPGAGFAEFPGGHVGAVQRPEEFAARLADTLPAGCP